MTTEQAYITGFVKRASEYGYNEAQALYILKEAGGLPLSSLPMPTGSKAPAAPASSPAEKPTMDQRITRFLGIKDSPTEVPRQSAGSYTGVLGK